MSPAAVIHRTPSRAERGFTLVEILIVVIILGILATVVIAQFGTAGVDSRKSSLLSQLQTVRNQIQLFKVQHNDVLPDLVNNGRTQMAGTTNLAGQVDATAAGIYGPYVPKVPVNPLNQNTGISAPGNAGATTGWIYDVTTGDFKATNQTATLVFSEDTQLVQ